MDQAELNETGTQKPKKEASSGPQPGEQRCSTSGCAQGPKSGTRIFSLVIMLLFLAAVASVLIILSLNP